MRVLAETKRVPSETIYCKERGGAVAEEDSTEADWVSVKTSICGGDDCIQSFGGLVPRRLLRL